MEQKTSVRTAGVPAKIRTEYKWETLPLSQLARYIKVLSFKESAFLTTRINCIVCSDYIPQTTWGSDGKFLDT
jgi:hypothetical protein